MSTFTLTPDLEKQFHEDGYILVRQLFDPEEVELLGNIARADRAMVDDALNRTDASGAKTRLSLRNELGDDVYSAFVSCRRVVEPMTTLLGGEIYHWHHKMMLKEPRVGGAWEWHQDYGYWYNLNCLYPDMASCYVSVDRASRENGCLQVIRGSHKAGRIEHGKTGEQTGANQERVDALLDRHELLYCEMGPGDALFFHGNTLHRSDQNRSEYPRWSLIGCYNTKHNSPFCETGPHPSYRPLEILPDEQVREIGRRQWQERQEAAQA